MWNTKNAAGNSKQNILGLKFEKRISGIFGIG
jgi:hypothetical protein